MRKSQLISEPTVSDFADLLRQPYSQASLAEMLFRWFGYSTSGSLQSTEIRSAVGSLVPIGEIYDTIRRDPNKRSALLDLVQRLRH